MPKYTATEFCRAVQSLEAKSLSAAETDGTVVDTRGYSECLVVANFGVAAANAEADVTIRESDNANGSNSSAVTGAVFTQVDVNNDQTTYVGRIDLSKRKRYLFARNVGDGANAVVLSVDLVLLHPKYGPASQVNTVAFSV